MKKIYTLSIAALIAIGSTTACQTNSATSNNTANQASNKANTTSAQNANQIAKPEANTAANEAKSESNSTTPTSALTPTATYKAYYAAHKNKDVAAIKKLIAKDMYEFFEMIGEGNPNPLEAGIKEICNQPQASSDEVKNEKISGDKATLQIQNPSGDWITADFVKEDGVWKMTAPKMDEPDTKPDTKK